MLCDNFKKKPFYLLITLFIFARNKHLFMTTDKLAYKRGALFFCIILYNNNIINYIQHSCYL